jgi:hypothetical protein
VWNTPTTELSNAGNGQTFAATLIDPSGNYETATGNITVNIAKAAGIFGSPATLSATYSPTLKLSDLPALPANYAWNTPTTVLSAGNGQTFAATFTDPSGNYEAATGNITVNVAKVAGIFTTHAALSATYSPALKLSDLTLTTGYAFNAPTTQLTVANNGQTFSATFTDPSGNYEPATGNITVNVAKAKVSAPAVTNTDLVYTGSELSAEITTDVTYTVNGEVEGTNASNYSATVILKDKSNYEWADGSTDDIVLNWTIAKATPTQIVFPTTNDITYDPSKTLLQISFVGGAGDGIFSWEDASITPNANNSGYNVVFTPRDANNYDYTGIDLEKTVALSVNKAEGTFTAHAAVNTTYSPTLTLGSLSLTNGYVFNAPTTQLTVANNGQTFAATFTDPSGNYEAASGSITVNVAKGTPMPPAAISATYTSTLRLSNLSLPDGYVWDNPNITLSVGDNQRFAATFFDWNGNYNTTSGLVTVNVAKATGTFTAHAAVNTTYSPTLTLADLTWSPSYTWDAPATQLTAGSQRHAAIFTDPSGNYEPATGDIMVNVAKATPTYTTPTGLTAKVEQALSAVTLTAGWSWMTPTTLVGAVGNQTHKAKFTPTDVVNYNAV